ncbi:MAG: nucleotidyltransferase domain-containing protein [Sphingobacteriaceae bacterium]|nr:nucleotidyltransferase domain-containing protein [Sphingobacteriaceae bacterium]
MNNTGLSDLDISLLRDILQKHPEVRLVHLFGSRAKGNFKKGSDIDLAIMNALEDESIINRIKGLLEDSSLPYLTDIVYYPGLKHQELRDHINRVGVEFYKAQ